MNEKKRLASNTKLLSVYSVTSAAKSTIDNELNLIPKHCNNIAEFYCKLPYEFKQKSLIYRSINYYLNLNNFYQNKENVEDIVNEAMFLLHEASFKYFEKIRDYNIEQFAIVHIRENIKSFLSKCNGLNSSDQNELIHTAIKIVKKNSKNSFLTYEEAKHLANHFNLCDKFGYKKIWKLESLHFDKIPLWKKKKDKDGSLEEICIADKKEIGLYDNFNESEYYNPEFKIEKNDELKDINIKKNILRTFGEEISNQKEKVIFKHRIYNENLSFLKLREISNLLGISIQRISKIEKKLKVQLKKIYDIEKKKTADIR